MARVYLKSYDDPNQRMTIHFQPGPKVYIKSIDRVVDMRDSNWAYLLSTLIGGDEIVGSGQGTGLETAWYDGSNLGYVNSPDPWELKALANRVGKHFRKKVKTRVTKQRRAEFTNTDEDWVKRAPSNKRELDIHKKLSRKRRNGHAKRS